MTNHAAALADLVAELTDEVHTRETVVRHRTVRRGTRNVQTADVLAHHTRDVGLLSQLGATITQPAGRLVRVPILDGNGQPARIPILGSDGHPITRPRWSTTDHTTRDQIQTVPATRIIRRPGPARARAGAAVPARSAGWDADGALTPIRSATATSRPPVTEATWLLIDIHQAARQLHHALAATADTGHPHRRPNDLADTLSALVGLITQTDTDTAARTVRAVRSWRQAARLLLGYDTPIVRLNDIVCPDCGGPLNVRSDASSEVWCSGRWTIHGPALQGRPWPVTQACGVTYPRHTWLDLLTTTTPPPPATPAVRPRAHATTHQGSGGRA